MKIIFAPLNALIWLWNFFKFTAHLEGQRHCADYTAYDFRQETPYLPLRVAAINVAAALDRVFAAINVSADPASEWVEIKYGVYPNKVGLQVLDRASADEMTKAFNSVASRAATMFRGLPIYVGHPDDPDWRRENPGVTTQAIGRVKELQAADDRLRIRRALNEDGKRLVGGEAAAFDAFSPNWLMAPITHQGRKAFRPVELLSIGLTNNPNIPGTYIGLNEKLPEETPVNSPAMNKHIIALLAALGRPLANAATVTDEQLAAAVNEAVPVATSAITAVNELATVKGQLTTANGQVTALNEKLPAANGRVKELGDARTELVLTSAVNEGRITQAQRAEWLGKFTATGADFAAVSADLGKLKKAINTRNKVGALGDRKGEELATGNQITAINTAVAKHIKENGLDPVRDYTVAYNAVRQAKAELFSNDTAAE